MQVELNKPQQGCAVGSFNIVRDSEVNKKEKRCSPPARAKTAPRVQ